MTNKFKNNVQEYLVTPHHFSIKKVLNYIYQLRHSVQKRHLFYFFVHVILYKKIWCPWLTFLEKNVPHKATHLLSLSLRRYLRYWFHFKTKISILQDHYSLFSDRFSSEFFTAISQSSGLRLAQLSGRYGDHHYEIILHHILSKEGEIGLHLRDTAKKLDLIKIRGTFGRGKNGSLCFWVGALQGPLPPYGLKDLAFTTKDLHNFRPKNIILHSLIKFCEAIEVYQLYLPSRRNHASYRWWCDWFLTKKISTNYEEFWQEFTQERLPWGDFCLHLPLTTKNIEDIPQKRRKDWKIRQGYIKKIQEDISNCLLTYSKSTKDNVSHSSIN